MLLPTEAAALSQPGGRGLGVEVGVRGGGGGKEEGGVESETNKLVKDEDGEGIKEMFQEMQFVELGQGRAQPPRNPDCCAAPLTPNSHGRETETHWGRRGGGGEEGERWRGVH